MGNYEFQIGDFVRVADENELNKYDYPFVTDEMLKFAGGIYEVVDSRNDEYARNYDVGIEAIYRLKTSESWWWYPDKVLYRVDEDEEYDIGDPFDILEV